jgi:hypothetical protein
VDNKEKKKSFYTCDPLIGKNKTRHSNNPTIVNEEGERNDQDSSLHEQKGANEWS